MQPLGRCHGQGGRGLPLSKIHGQKEKVVDEPPSMSQIRGPRGRGRCSARPTANGGRSMPQQLDWTCHSAPTPHPPSLLSPHSLSLMACKTHFARALNFLRACACIRSANSSTRVVSPYTVSSAGEEISEHEPTLARRRGELLSSLNTID